MEGGPAGQLTSMGRTATIKPTLIHTAAIGSSSGKRFAGRLTSPNPFDASDYPLPFHAGLSRPSYLDASGIKRDHARPHMGVGEADLGTRGEGFAIRQGLAPEGREVGRVV